jgi:hypothetical protein
MNKIILLMWLLLLFINFSMIFFFQSLHLNFGAQAREEKAKNSCRHKNDTFKQQQDFFPQEGEKPCGWIQ